MLWKLHDTIPLQQGRQCDKLAWLTPVLSSQLSAPVNRPVKAAAVLSGYLHLKKQPRSNSIQIYICSINNLFVFTSTAIGCRNPPVQHHPQSTLLCT